METVKVIDDNQEALLWRLRMINNAKKKIVLFTFKLRADNSGKDVLSALVCAAKRGVEVHVLVDAISTHLHCKRSKEIKYLSSLENVHFCIYNPVFFSNPLRITFRLHDKILSIDEDVYMIGGRNVLDVSIGNYVQKYNIDRDVVVLHDEEDEKPSIEQICKYTRSMRNGKIVKEFKGRLSEEETKRVEAELLERQNALRIKEPFITRNIYDVEKEEFLPVQDIRLIKGDPEFRYKGLEIFSQLVRLMEAGDDVLVQTPYIMCNRLMYQGICEVIKATRSFAILTNAPEAGANYFGSADYMNQRRKIRKRGIKVFECSAGQSVHTKSIMIDDDISLIGSFNFDTRSAYMDTELMLMIHSKELNRKLRDSAEALIKCSRITDATGKTVYGENYVKKSFGLFLGAFYIVLRLAVRPFRFFL